jgi:two-component system, OmpR family, response regulator RpaB
MPKKKCILVVEDEDAIRRGVVDILSMAGHQVVEAADGVVGLSEARRPGVDLVLLDLLLPKKDGFDVLTELRTSHPSLPVIILTARGSEDDRVRGLRIGADDYVVKPFAARELLARVDAVLRRSPERPQPLVKIVGNDTVVDCARREVCHGPDNRVPLSQMESDILLRLASNAGRAVSREELLSSVWGLSDGTIETRAIDMHITRLRQKLSRGSSEPDKEWIVTVRGKGYMLGPDLEVVTEGVRAESGT